jgi:hypothetical protein
LLSIFGSGTNFTSLALSTPGLPTGIMITGHSLGGGLASTATIVSGFSTSTFNAAGLSDMTKALADSVRIDVGYFALSNIRLLINDFVTENDLVNTLLYPLGLQALGQKIILQDENIIPLTTHSMIHQEHVLII